MSLRLRAATPQDGLPIGELIAESARTLGRSFYSSRVIEAALKGVWGLDTQLIADGTYFVLCAGEELAACGGWSYRDTLFGSDTGACRSPRRLDPETEPARVRAFFVRPAYARQGLGSRLMVRCEQEARAAGFRALCLGATAPGRRLYERHGFVLQRMLDAELGGGLSMPIAQMHKSLMPSQ